MTSPPKPHRRRNLQKKNFNEIKAQDSIKAENLPLQSDTKENERNIDELQDNAEMMRRIKDVMDAMRNINDQE